MDPEDERARWPADLADVAQRLDARFREHSSYLPTLGGSVADWGPGWAVVHLTPTGEQAGLTGTVSHAVLAAVADSALEFASNSYGRECLAISLTAQYHAPAPVLVPLVAVARERARHDRTVSYQIDIQVADEAAAPPVATFDGRVYRTHRWHMGEDAYPQWWRDQH